MNQSPDVLPAPKPGQVFEKDGRRRRVFKLRDLCMDEFPNGEVPPLTTYYVIWGLAEGSPSQCTWWSNWHQWQSGATLVEGAS